MKALRRFPLVAVFLSVFSITAQAENCNDLLNLGYMNINHSISEYDSVVSAYRNFCSTSYSSASSDKKRGIEISFDYLKELSGKLGYNWGKTLTQETWSQICEDTNTYNKLSTYQSIDSSEISNIALSAWQNCLALNARGLKSDFSMTQDLTGLTGTLYWTGSSAISFLGVDNNGLGKASCNVTAFIGNKYVTKPVAADTTFKLSTKTANFNCQRTTGLDEQSRITAQATRLTFKTSEGKLDVDLAPITLTQIDAKKIDGLYQQIDTLSQRTTAVETLANTTANQVANQIVVASAGAISSNGTIVISSGASFTVNKQQAGTYRINFSVPFSKSPVVVALSDGGTRGSKAVLSAIDNTGFTIETRAYDTNVVSDAGFNFIVGRSN